MKILNILPLLTAMTLGLAMCGGCTTSRATFQRPAPGEDLEKIIYYGSLAGNSHNTQPWKVRIINNSSFEVHADFSRKLHVVDDTARGLYISLGAFIENCAAAAGAMGYRCDVTYTADKNSDEKAAVITLARAAADTIDLKDIEARRTIRTPFSAKPLSESHLSGLIAGEGGSAHYFTRDSAEGKYIERNTALAYAQQARDPAAKDELAGWMRFSNKDAVARRDGLTTSGMGIGGIAGFIVSNFMKPEDSKTESFVNEGIKKAAAQLSSYAGWIVITQPADTPQMWMETGRIYERINIRCRKYMIGFHPVNAMIEEDNYEREAARAIPLKGKIQFIARVGYVDSYPDAVSVRRDIREIIR